VPSRKSVLPQLTVTQLAGLQHAVWLVTKAISGMDQLVKTVGLTLTIAEANLFTARSLLMAKQLALEDYAVSLALPHTLPLDLLAKIF